VGALEAAEGASIMRLKRSSAAPDEIAFRRLVASVRFDAGPALSHCVEVQIHLK